MTAEFYCKISLSLIVQKDPEVCWVRWESVSSLRGPLKWHKVDKLSTKSSMKKKKKKICSKTCCGYQAQPYRAMRGIWRHAGMFLIVALTIGVGILLAVDVQGPSRSCVCSRSETRAWRICLSYDASIESENMLSVGWKHRRAIPS